MIQLVYSPQWFYGKDIVIDIVSIVVLFLIAFFSMRYYKLAKDNKNYLYLALSFITIAVSLLFQIATNFTIYYNELIVQKLGAVTLTYTELEPTNILFLVGHLVHSFLMLLGFYFLYSIYTKQEKSNIVLIIFLILIATYFSTSAYYILHLMALILLVMISLSYFRNYKKTGHYTAKWLFWSFALITLSQAVFVFVGIHAILYVIAELIQLAGFVGLLLTFIKVLKYGKKKGKK